MIRNFRCAKVINFAIITITWLLNEVDISPSIWLMVAHLLLTRVILNLSLYLRKIYAVMFSGIVVAVLP